MAVSIQFDFFGEPQLTRTIDRKLSALNDFTPAFNRIIDDFTAETRTQFASSGQGKWPALSPKYAHWKAIKYPGMPIMRRTDALYKELTERPLGIERISRTDAVFGTSKKYAVIHQKGGWVVGQPPMRKVIDITDNTKERWVKILQEHLIAGDRAANGTPDWAPPTGPEIEL